MAHPFDLDPDGCDCQYCRTARAILGAPGDDESE